MHVAQFLHDKPQHHHSRQIVVALRAVHADVSALGCHDHQRQTLEPKRWALLWREQVLSTRVPVLLQLDVSAPAIGVLEASADDAMQSAECVADC